MLGVFAEFETNLRRERQLEGIKAAKAKGIYKGRKASIDPLEVRRLREARGSGPRRSPGASASAAPPSTVSSETRAVTVPSPCFSERLVRARCPRLRARLT